MNELSAGPFSRTALLVGDEAMQRIVGARVVLFGTGGVGSWCAEALVRSGVGHLTLVDPDYVEVSNLNRQLPALITTVGRPKVEVLRERLLAINPEADIVARQERFSADTAADFPLQDYDYVIDAIDSLADKLELILSTTHYSSPSLPGSKGDTACDRSGAKLEGVPDGRGRVSLPTLFSSMGAARKMDPMQVRVSEFWRVDGCPLAASLRKRMRRAQRFPERKFKCVWSPERIKSAQPKGTLMPVTAAFGLTLASLVLQDLAQQR